MLKKTRITEEIIYSKLSDEDIFRKYFGDFEIGKAYSSVFRKDRNPSTAFYETKGGNINYKDFATGENLAAINFVMKLYNISYPQALDRIAIDFDILDGNKYVKKVIKKQCILKEPQEKEFWVGVGSWTKEALNYWKSYYITQEELELNKVYYVTRFRIKRQGKAPVEIYTKEGEPRFAYQIKDLSGNIYTKIYSPLSEDYRWVGNCPATVPFGLYELPFSSKRLIITKSQKDRILLKKYFSDVIAVQHEAITVLTEEVCSFLNEMYDEIYINFDIDHYFDIHKKREVYIGKEAATHFVEKYGWKRLELPDIYYERLKIKDVSDLVKQRGLESLEKFLKINNLWITD